MQKQANRYDDIKAAFRYQCHEPFYIFIAANLCREIGQFLCFFACFFALTYENTSTTYWPGLPALFWLSSYVAGHCLTVVPLSGAKKNFYCTVYYITLKSNCEAQRASKNLKKIVEDRVRHQK
jgi:hypothetical protein